MKKKFFLLGIYFFALHIMYSFGVDKNNLNELLDNIIIKFYKDKYSWEKFVKENNNEKNFINNIFQKTYESLYQFPDQIVDYFIPKESELYKKLMHHNNIKLIDNQIEIINNVFGIYNSIDVSDQAVENLLHKLNSNFTFKITKQDITMIFNIVKEYMDKIKNKYNNNIMYYPEKSQYFNDYKFQVLNLNGKIIHEINFSLSDIKEMIMDKESKDNIKKGLEDLIKKEIKKKFKEENIDFQCFAETIETDQNNFSIKKNLINNMRGRFENNIPTNKYIFIFKYSDKIEEDFSTIGIYNIRKKYKMLQEDIKKEFPKQAEKTFIVVPKGIAQKMIYDQSAGHSFPYEIITNDKYYQKNKNDFYRYDENFQRKDEIDNVHKKHHAIEVNSLKLPKILIKNFLEKYTPNLDEQIYIVVPPENEVSNENINVYFTECSGYPYEGNYFLPRYMIEGDFGGSESLFQMPNATDKLNMWEEGLVDIKESIKKVQNFVNKEVQNENEQKKILSEKIILTLIDKAINFFINDLATLREKEEFIIINLKDIIQQMAIIFESISDRPYQDKLIQFKEKLFKLKSLSAKKIILCGITEEKDIKYLKSLGVNKIPVIPFFPEKNLKAYDKNISLYLDLLQLIFIDQNQLYKKANSILQNKNNKNSHKKIIDLFNNMTDEEIEMFCQKNLYIFRNNINHTDIKKIIQIRGLKYYENDDDLLNAMEIDDTYIQKLAEELDINKKDAKEKCIFTLRSHFTHHKDFADKNKVFLYIICNNNSKIFQKCNKYNDRKIRQREIEYKIQINNDPTINKEDPAIPTVSFVQHELEDILKQEDVYLDDNTQRALFEDVLTALHNGSENPLGAHFEKQKIHFILHGKPGVGKTGGALLSAKMYYIIKASIDGEVSAGESVYICKAGGPNNSFHGGEANLLRRLIERINNESKIGNNVIFVLQDENGKLFKSPDPTHHNTNEDTIAEFKNIIQTIPGSDYSGDKAQGSILFFTTNKTIDDLDSGVLDRLNSVYFDGSVPTEGLKANLKANGYEWVNERAINSVTDFGYRKSISMLAPLKYYGSIFSEMLIYLNKEKKEGNITELQYKEWSEILKNTSNDVVCNYSINYQINEHLNEYLNLTKLDERFFGNRPADEKDNINFQKSISSIQQAAEGLITAFSSAIPFGSFIKGSISLIFSQISNQKKIDHVMWSLKNKWKYRKIKSQINDITKNNNIERYNNINNLNSNSWTPIILASCIGLIGGGSVGGIISENKKLGIGIGGISGMSVGGLLAWSLEDFLNYDASDNKNINQDNKNINNSLQNLNQALYDASMNTETLKNHFFEIPINNIFTTSNENKYFEPRGLKIHIGLFKKIDNNFSMKSIQKIESCLLKIFEEQRSERIDCQKLLLRVKNYFDDITKNSITLEQLGKKQYLSSIIIDVGFKELLCYDFKLSKNNDIQKWRMKNLKEILNCLNYLTKRDKINKTFLKEQFLANLLAYANKIKHEKAKIHDNDCITDIASLVYFNKHYASDLLSEIMSEKKDSDILNSIKYSSINASIDYMKETFDSMPYTTTGDITNILTKRLTGGGFGIKEWEKFIEEVEEDKRISKNNQNGSNTEFLKYMKKEIYYKDKKVDLINYIIEKSKEKNEHAKASKPKFSDILEQNSISNMPTFLSNNNKKNNNEENNNEENNNEENNNEENNNEENNNEENNNEENNNEENKLNENEEIDVPW